MSHMIHLTQMIGLLGQRIDNPDLEFQERAELLQELLDKMQELDYYVTDELYAVEQTVDGQHAPDGRWNWYGEGEDPGDCNPLF